MCRAESVPGIIIQFISNERASSFVFQTAHGPSLLLCTYFELLRRVINVLCVLDLCLFEKVEMSPLL